jgi:hypothetical protein
MIVPISESSERLPPELNNIGAKIMCPSLPYVAVVEVAGKL